MVGFRLCLVGTCVALVHYTGASAIIKTASDVRTAAGAASQGGSAVFSGSRTLTVATVSSSPTQTVAVTSGNGERPFTVGATEKVVSNVNNVQVLSSDNIKGSFAIGATKVVGSGANKVQIFSSNKVKGPFAVAATKAVVSSAKDVPTFPSKNTQGSFAIGVVKGATSSAKNVPQFSSNNIGGASAGAGDEVASNAIEIQTPASVISNNVTKEAVSNVNAVRTFINTLSKQQPGLKSDVLPSSTFGKVKALRVSVVFAVSPCGKRKCCRLRALGGACSCLRVGAKCYDFLLPPAQPKEPTILSFLPPETINVPCPPCYSACGNGQCCRLLNC